MGPPSVERFQIRRELGHGAMGVVYEAFDGERRSPVALKTLNRFDADALARFKREFRAMQGIAHPNLVALGELFFENEQWFFTMELLDGVDLLSYITGRQLSISYQSTVRDTRALIAAYGPSAVYEREKATFDEAKLRAAMRQLVEGLAALHAADKVHRDVKPSNVLVTRGGRVVLLDFGLVTEASVDDRSTGPAVIGTPAYMAPEQAASREVGPPADLYAVGVMLYEALTGRLPIDGTQLQILLDKQTREPPPPASIAPGIPADLNTLCTKLLRFDPALRPTAADVLRTLAVPGSIRAAAVRTTSDAPVFVGRDAELVQLRAAFDETLRGKLATVFVCGESGIGKSYMVRRFTSQLLTEHPEAMLLEGRCYERETVPYKTLDGVADALSQRLSRMHPTDVSAVLPTRCATIAQVFPVMLHVPQLAKTHAATARHVEPHEVRKQAFEALGELLVRIATRRPTVIVIDDMQWSDDDGLRALGEILRGRDAPPLLLVGTVRTPAGRDDAGLARIRAAIQGSPRIVELAKLGLADARDLAMAALRRSDARDADPEIVAREAGGHPLFVEELARHVALGGSARDDVKLDDAIWSRVVQLEGPTREMAELVAIAGKPIPQEVAAAAARVEPAEFNRCAARLRVSNLARTSGARWADAIEPYHDRVREAVLGQLPIERRRALHEALAIAFEASAHDDPETLATHWREAGNAARAARHAAAAGDQASSKFAFDHAAQWYEQALGLLPDVHPSRRELRIKLGDALAFAGRGALAATEFEAAATESDPVEALDLRRRAAEQLLCNGHFDRGIQAIRGVLGAIGMRLPTTTLGTFWLLIYCTLLLRLRGRRFEVRGTGRITAEELGRIDACWSVGMTLICVDTFLGFAFMSRSLLLALKYGDLERIVRAFAMLVAYGAAAGQPAWRRTDLDARYARELQERSGTARSRLFVEGGVGGALYLCGRFAESASLLRDACEALGTTAPELVFERVTVRHVLTQSLEMLGRYGELQKISRELLWDARARGDIYASVLGRTHSPSFTWLAEDRAELAEQNAIEAMREWSTGGFHFEHVYALVTRINAKLYLGEAEEAYALATECVDRGVRTLLWRIQLNRARSWYLRGMAALLLVERGGGDRERLLRIAAKDARAIEREKTAWTAPLGALMRAGIAVRRGDRASAIRKLEGALRGFEAVEMAGFAAAARDRAARLRNDEHSAAEIERASAALRAEGVVAPERFIAMLAPGLTP